MKNKVIIWDNGNFFPFILCNSLKAIGDFDFYAVIDTTNKTKKFFESQQFVKFTKIWFYHDHILPHKDKINTDYLEKFEKKYNIDLWLLTQNERLFNQQYNDYYKFSTNEILAIIEDECKLFEQILDETTPEFFITTETTLHHHHLFYLLCRAKGVKVMMLNQSKFGYKCIVSQELHKLDFVNTISPKYPHRNFDELQEYMKSFDMLKQLIHHKNSFLSSKKSKLNAAIQFLLISNNSNVRTHYSYYGRNKVKVLIKEFIYSIRRKYRESFINNNLGRKIDGSVPFVYFPLHQEPERVTLVGSPYFTNQLEIVRYILKSLPIGYRLLVKEHPTQHIRGWRSVSYYKQLMNLPNLILMHPSIRNDELLKKSSLVITIAGTTGLEAAFYGKASIIFSDLGYSLLPSVFKVNSPIDLPLVIKTALEHKVDPAYLDYYVELLDQNSFDFDWFHYISSYQNLFYYGGHLVDTEIQQEKMDLFIKEHKTTFDKLAKEYVKKIEQLKTNYSSS
jgi:hypothetical protein